MDNKTKQAIRRAKEANGDSMMVGEVRVVNIWVDGTLICVVMEKEKVSRTMYRIKTQATVLN